MNYEILDAARQFIAIVHASSDADLEATFQVLATNANDSDYGCTHEPLSGVCEAILAEQKRRLLTQKEAAEDLEDLEDLKGCLEE